MAISKALKRLLSVRAMEEEQRRAALEFALTDLRQIEAGLEECAARERRGRELIAVAQDTAARVAGRVEMEAAKRRAHVLTERKAEAQSMVAQVRQAYFETRIERRQAESLVQDAQSREDIALAHSAQQSLDEWYAANSAPAGKGARQNGGEDEEIVSENPRAIPNEEKGFHI